MTIKAVPEEIRAAAKAARDLAEQAAAVPLVAVADSAEGAVPGGEAATAAAELATAWRTGLDTLGRAIDAHATAMTSAAQSYDTQEAANVDPFMGRPGGVPQW